MNNGSPCPLCGAPVAVLKFLGTFSCPHCGWSCDEDNVPLAVCAQCRAETYDSEDLNDECECGGDFVVVEAG